MKDIKEPFIYLKKYKISTLEEVDFVLALRKYYQDVDEYKASITAKKNTISIELLNIHLQELFDIAITCRFIYQWLEFDTIKEDSFIKIIKSKKTFDMYFHYTSWYLMNQDLNDLNKNLLESMDSAYGSIKEILFFNYSKYRMWRWLYFFRNLKFKTSHKEDNDQFLNILLNHEVYVNLGLVNYPAKVIKQTLFEGEFRNGMHDFINGSICQINKDDGNLIKREDIKLFLAKTAHKCMDKYFEIWSAAHEAVQKRKSKSAVIKDLSKEEVIQKILNTYTQLPRHFFEILTTVPYKGKIVLNEDYTINKGFNNLLITEIDYFSENKEVDWVSLGQLFGKESSSLGNYSKKKDKKYVEKHVMPFDDFLQLQEEKYD